MGSQKPLRARALRVWHRIGLRLAAEVAAREDERRRQRDELLARSVELARKRLETGVIE